MAADPTAIQRAWDDARRLRQSRESEWQLIADHFLPRKDFTCTPVPGQLRQRRVATGVGQTALRRATALFIAYLIDPTQPFINPNVSRGMVAAGRAAWSSGRDGRRLELGAASRDYLDDLRWRVFDVQMLPQSGFLTAMGRSALEFMAFGNCSQWIGRKRGFGPRWQHRPLRSCWWTENEDGEIDTHFFRFRLPAWRVVQRYPEADKVDKIRELAADEKKADTLVELLHVVEPRANGRVGAVATNKPFASVIYLPEHKAVVEETGYDSFPYAVARMEVEDGSAYGTGLGWSALPDVMAINHIQAGVERGVDLRNDPPVMMPQRLFGNKLDRRPGGVSFYDPTALGFGNLRDAVQKMDVAGDPGVGERWMAFLTQNVEQTFFVDWMRLRESGQMTAEEVRERRDLRIRALSFLVPAVDRDLIGRGADRQLEVMAEEGQLAAPPPELSEIDVDWDYAGPLAMAQKLNQVDGVLRLFEATRMAAEFDETAPDVLAVEEGLRSVADALGVSPAVTRSREEVESRREERAQQAAQQQELEAMNAQAAALRDGAQGFASLENSGAAEAA